MKPLNTILVGAMVITLGLTACNNAEKSSTPDPANTGTVAVDKDKVTVDGGGSSVNTENGNVSVEGGGSSVNVDNGKVNVSTGNGTGISVNTAGVDAGAIPTFENPALQVWANDYYAMFNKKVVATGDKLKVINASMAAKAANVQKEFTGKINGTDEQKLKIWIEALSTVDE